MRTAIGEGEHWERVKRCVGEVEQSKEWKEHRKGLTERVKQYVEGLDMESMVAELIEKEGLIHEEVNIMTMPRLQRTITDFIKTQPVWKAVETQAMIGHYQDDEVLSKLVQQALSSG